jgi:hypothetical protein
VETIASSQQPQQEQQQQQQQAQLPEAQGASKRLTAVITSTVNGGSSGDELAVHPPADAAGSTAAARVHSRMDLLQHIMSLVGKGEWAFIAPVSRMARTAYMAAMFDTYSGASNICRTGAAAAAQSVSRLDMALASSDGAALVRAQLQWLAGHVRKWSVTSKLQQLGMAVNKRTLLAAARAGSLLSLQRIKQRMVGTGAPPTADDWRQVGQQLARYGAGAGPLA